jgi:hypothetical protein
VTLISQREFARRNGVSAEAIRRAVKIGRLPSTNGQLDATKAQLKWDSIKDPQRAGKKLRRHSTEVSGASLAQPAPPAPTINPAAQAGVDKATSPQVPAERTYDDAKTQREYLRVERERLALDQSRGELVNAADVRKEISEMILQARAKLLRLGHKLAPRLALETDRGVCQALLQTGIDEALQDLVSYGRRK